MNAEELKEAVAKLESLKGEDKAKIIFIDRKAFPYRSCTIMHGYYRIEGKYFAGDFIRDKAFHVICCHGTIPPTHGQSGKFETAEEVFTDFLVNGKPLRDYVKSVEVNPPPIVFDW